LVAGAIVLGCDAHHFLRDSLFNATSFNPEIYWHRPIIVTDMRTPLGSVIGRMKVEPAYPEDDVIDDDLILVWGEEKRIITGADLLGRLLRGIVTQDLTENRLANSFSSVGGQGPDHVRGNPRSLAI
jgi:hypothetical protein